MVDILFHETLINMGFIDTQLTRTDMPSFGFSGVESRVEGTSQLPVTMHVEPW